MRTRVLMLLLLIFVVGTIATTKSRAQGPAGSLPVYITGNVKQPQKIIWREGLTLTQALALSGGVLPKTRTNSIRVYRKKNDRIGAEEIKIDLKAIKKHRTADVILQPYDIINVPRKGAFSRGDVFVAFKSFSQII